MAAAATTCADAHTDADRHARADEHAPSRRTRRGDNTPAATGAGSDEHAWRPTSTPAATAARKRRRVQPEPELQPVVRRRMRNNTSVCGRQVFIVPIVSGSQRLSDPVTIAGFALVFLEDTAARTGQLRRSPPSW
jgi:hypothetical protein